MDWASPAISRPVAKTSTPASTPGRGDRRSPTSPPTTMPTTEVTRKALKGQAYQATASSSATALGIAVPTAMASKATRVTRVSRPVVVRRCSASQMLAPSTSRPTPYRTDCFPGRAERRPPSGTGAPGDCVLLLLPGVDLLGGSGDDGVQVADDTEVGQLEDRRLGVLVDGDDGLAGLHAGAVLDGTG